MRLHRCRFNLSGGIMCGTTAGGDGCRYTLGNLALILLLGSLFSGMRWGLEFLLCTLGNLPPMVLSGVGRCSEVVCDVAFSLTV